MKSLPDIEIKQLAIKPGPKQYLAFDELARRIRDNPSSMNPYSMRLPRSLIHRSDLVKTGGRLFKHARYYWLLLAESHLTRRLFESMVRRTDRLALPPG